MRECACWHACAWIRMRRTGVLVSGASSTAAGTPGTQPQGTLKTQPQGTPGTQPQGTLKTKPQGTLKTQPQGTPGTQPQGTLRTRPQGTFGKRPQGTLRTQPQGTLRAQPQGTPLPGRWVGHDGDDGDTDSQFQFARRVTQRPSIIRRAALWRSLLATAWPTHRHAPR